MDGDDSIFKFEISLEKLSAISAAIRLWELPRVTNKIQKYFKETESPSRQTDSWKEIVNYVLAQADLLIFPDKLLCELKNYIMKIAERIHNWMIYVIKQIGFDVKHVLKIYWTSDGRIDELKIVQENWLKIKNFKAPNNKCFLGNLLICTACIYVEEKYIKANLDLMRDKINALLPKSYQKKRWTEYGILATWLCFCSSQSKSSGLGVIRDFKKTLNKAPANRLFDICVSNGYKLAVKYFWDRLTTSYKETYLMESAEVCWRNLQRSMYNTDIYRKENYLEILIFLIKQMPDIERMEFISKRFLSFFKIFLQVWPYQELCLNFLEQNFNFEQSTCKSLLNFIINILADSTGAIEYRNENIYHLIFQKLLKKISKEDKEELFLRRSFQNRLNDLYKTSDVVSLSLIINDKDLKEHKQGMIADAQEFLKGLLFQGNFKSVTFLMENVFSDVEKKSFKENSNFLSLFLTLGEVKLAEDHLNWLYDEENERKSAKEKIDAVEICDILVKKRRLDLADKFLLWRFDSEEERRNVKKALNKSDKFLRNEIYKIWCSKSPDVMVTAAKNKCSEFLKWFLETEEAIYKFKSSKLIKNEFFVEKYWNCLFYESSLFVHLDEFLKFCLWTPGKIEEYKKNISKKSSWCIDTFAVERNNLLMLDALFDWCLNPEQKKKIIHDYMNSPKGALLCVSVFKNCANYSAPVLQLFNGWLESSNNIDVSMMKMNLNSFDETFVKKNVISCILFLLEKVKNGETITLSHLKQHVYIKSVCVEDENVKLVENEDSNDQSDSDSNMYMSGSDEYYDSDDEFYHGPRNCVLC